MFNIEGGHSRRGFLQTSVGLGALMLPVSNDSPQASGASPVRKARSVIFLLLEGGMSHLETWDPKPNAPKEIRGTFENIPTSNPILRIGEHLPLLAQQAHRYNVLRSVHSAARNHSPGLHWILTGYDNPAASVGGQTVNNYPSVGAIVAHELGSVSETGLPNFVSIPRRTQLGGRVNYTGAMHLGSSCDAFESGTVPAKSAENYVIPAGLTLPKEMAMSRLQNRRALLDSIDRLQRERTTSLSGVSEYQHQAFDLLLGDRGRNAFDINREPAAVRERYGNSEIGQGTLLARRLVEAGVNYVLVNYSKNNSFDTHGDNFNRLKNVLLPPTDRAVSALLADLDERGMLEETLVVMMGEMGRTPLINKQKGRDHWPDVYSILMAGGGLTRGQVLGSSSRDGGSPADRPIHVDDVLATVYAQLGIDPHLAILDHLNRPVPILPHSEPVGELISG